MNRATVTVERDEFSKDFYIVLPERLLDKMGWKVGDNLKMDIIKMGIDRSLLIKKSDSDT
jgi:bifunctional DNA-binding transcriptional regulator/antitoxin component of YhaV-PrlF toxin-antitoxin module